MPRISLIGWIHPSELLESTSLPDAARLAVELAGSYMVGAWRRRFGISSLRERLARVRGELEHGLADSLPPATGVALVLAPSDAP